MDFAFKFKIALCINSIFISIFCQDAIPCLEECFFLHFLAYFFMVQACDELMHSNTISKLFIKLFTRVCLQFLLLNCLRASEETQKKDG